MIKGCIRAYQAVATRRLLRENSNVKNLNYKRKNPYSIIIHASPAKRPGRSTYMHISCTKYSTMHITKTKKILFSILFYTNFFLLLLPLRFFISKTSIPATASVIKVRINPIITFN